MHLVKRYFIKFVPCVISILAIVISITNCPAKANSSSAGGPSIGNAELFAKEFQTPLAKTSIRYWFLTDNATDEQIWKEMKDIGEAGFAGVEICNKSGTLETEAWIHMMQTLVQAAEQYGINVSFTFYNDGPTSVPVKYLTPEASSMQLISGYTELSAGDFTLNGNRYVYSGKIPEAKASASGFGGGGGPPGDGGPRGEGAGGPGTGGPGGSGLPEGGAPPGGGAPGGSGAIGGGGEPGGGMPMAGPPQGGMPDGTGGGEKKLVAVTVAKKTGGIHLDQGFGYAMTGKKSEYSIQVKELDPKSLLVVTPGDEGSPVVWSIPTTEDPSDYVIFSFYSMASVSAGSSGTGKATVNHFATEGAEAMFAFYEDTVFAKETIKRYFQTHGGSMFEDSLELMGNPMWTTNLPKEFKARQGYDLTDKMPVLINRFYNSFSTPAETDVRFGFSDASDRLIANDFNELLDTLYQEYHLKPINKWVNANGMIFKVQAYNGNETGHHDTIQNATMIDIIEGESLAFMEIHSGIDSFRYLAGGSHIAGKQIISDELAAVMGGAYNITVADVVAIANKNAAGGANKFILHGYPSEQTTGQSWPGYHAFGTMFTDPWEDRQPVWQDVRIMTDYLSRTEMILQTGKAKLDVAVYRDLKYVKFPHIKNEALTGYGYSYEYLSPDVLDAEYAHVTNGILAADSAAYKAMVFDNQTFMIPETVSRLQKYADAGLPLIFIGKTPEKSPYYLNADTGNKRLASSVAKLLSTENIYQIYSIDRLADKLREIGITPAADYAGKSDIIALHRNDIGKADFYWFFNKAEKAESVEVTLTGTGTPYFLNAWTGDITPITKYNTGKGTVTLTVGLEASATGIIVLTDAPIAKHFNLHVSEGDADSYYYNEKGGIIARASKAGNYKTILSDGSSKTLTIAQPGSISLNNSQWSLNVESWSRDAEDPNGMIKTNLEYKLDKPVGWTKIQGLETVSGRATYSTSFDLADWTDTQGAYLSLELGKGTSAVTKIVINGNTLPVMDQSAKVIDAGRYLVKGKNTVEIDIATFLYNTVSGTPEYAYGLTGATFTPYYDAVVTD